MKASYQIADRKDSRALSTYRQAVLALRWLFDDTRLSQLARDNDIGLSTAYDYRDEVITVLAARQPSLHGALLAAKAAGHTHVLLDGTLIRTDRISTPGPTRGVDLWWSGKHHHHGGNIQVVSAPDGWPLWTSGVRPGREHDTTAARADPDLLTQIAAWVDDGQLGLADLGYEGEADLLRIPIKKPAGGELTVDSTPGRGTLSVLKLPVRQIELRRLRRAAILLARLQPAHGPDGARGLWRI